MAPDDVARPVLRDPSKATTVIFMLLTLLFSSASAFAQSDAKAAAREHFAKGVAAFDERRFAEAAEEFDAAYKLSPAFVVLYNIGQVNVVLGRPVEAIDAFERYLKQGASTVPAERRREVEAEIEKQTARVGAITVHTTPAGAELRVDGALVGKTPFAKSLKIAAGRHIVSASLTNHATVNREVEVAGRGEVALELALELVAASAPAVVPAPVVAPPPEPPAPPTVVEVPVIEKTVIERTYVETPSLERRASEPLPPPRSSVSVQRIVGFVLLAGGLATATTGGILAYKGSTQSDDAKQILARPGLSDDEWSAAMADFDAGKSRNERGWIVAGVGAAVLVGGIVVLATVPERPPSYSLAPWVTGGAGGLAMNGAW